jgi:hypothetical protein
MASYVPHILPGDTLRLVDFDRYTQCQHKDDANACRSRCRRRVAYVVGDSHNGLCRYHAAIYWRAATLTADRAAGLIQPL